MRTFREIYEDREKEWLSPYACLSINSKGRLYPEEQDPYRTCFQRDRDRIIHSKAFRRLKRKTQVFLAPVGDHYRTRLTHTLEVVQIARSIARALRLNEDLTEAIALGHDLGHTPFGHAGERVLNKLSPNGFNHAQQSLKVVDILETRQGRKGLNLTYEVREGISHHSQGKHYILRGETPKENFCLEGLVVSISDVIAYITHDADDAIRANLIRIKDLPRNPVKILGKSPSEQINTMVRGVIEGSQGNMIQILPEIRNAMNELRDFLFEKIYPSEQIAKEIIKAERVVSELYQHFVKFPPDEIANKDFGDPNDTIEQKVVDFIAGMTDEYALTLYQKLFLPSPWQI
ncbi:MAG: deoxyguanosinetriphosphate triphosphohydrolase [Candidatus Hydrogenedentes bacterium]|nr:deoxyguanosinetriphosphate triphosphohydrolase [Candidatus Hydrogenedentota bacterium]